MKKILATTLAAMTVFHTAVFAAPVAISDVSINDGLITVEAINDSGTDSIFTLTVMKQDNTLTDEMQKLYATSQQKVKAGEKFLYQFLIMDERDGVRGSGTYRVDLKNSAGETDDETFVYADSQGVSDFIDAVKAAALTVTDANTAYLQIGPVVTAPESKGALFSMQIDRTELVADADIQNNTMNVFYASNKDRMGTLNATNFPQELRASFGLGTYNAGDTAKGLEILAPTYGSSRADATLYLGTLTLMNQSYASTDAFLTAFKMAYGLTTINTATVDDLETALKNFKAVNNACVTEIDSITGLAVGQKYQAYEKVVLALYNAKATTATELQAVLQNAMPDVGAPGGGGGGGGIVAGGADNRKPVDSNSMSGVGASGTTENKVTIFPDIPSGHWASQSISYLKAKGIVSGTDSGNFEPERSVSREEYAKMIVLACDIPATGGENPFTDIAADSWCLPYINTAVASGIVMGVDETRFGFGENISRQAMAVMTFRALKQKGVTLPKVRTYTGFADEEKIEAYAKEAVVALYEAGILNGKGENSFDPVGNATRAEAAKIIYEAVK